MKQTELQVILLFNIVVSISLKCNLILIRNENKSSKQPLRTLQNDEINFHNNFGFITVISINYANRTFIVISVRVNWKLVNSYFCFYILIFLASPRVTYHRIDSYRYLFYFPFTSGINQTK